LKNNNFKPFLSNLRRSIKHFNLKNNKLGTQGTKILNDWFAE